MANFAKAETLKNSGLHSLFDRREKVYNQEYSEMLANRDRQRKQVHDQTLKVQHGQIVDRTR
jgi:hypothetical protein